MKDMKRTAIVTRATKGIGEATAIALGEAGWWILASGRNNDEGKLLEQRLNKLAGGTYHSGDITADEAAEQLVGRVIDEMGRLDALVNNAGVHQVGTVTETEPEDYDRVMETNVRAAVLLARAAIPQMQKQQTGTIVNVSSEAGFVGFPRQVAYNMSKAALLMLTKSIVADYSADGIRAVSICPGTTLTPLVQTLIDTSPDPAARQRELASIRPANRLGKPEEIASAIVFALSEKAAFMTGSSLIIDGGNLAVP